MTTGTIGLGNIFYKDLLSSIERIKARNGRFVHYTDANAAISIIQNKEVWMRDSRCMNDYSESEHGWQCLRNSYENSSGQELQEALNMLCPSITCNIEEEVKKKSTQDLNKVILPVFLSMKIMRIKQADYLCGALTENLPVWHLLCITTLFFHLLRQ